MEKEIYILDGKRTPFLAVGDKPNVHTSVDLAVSVGQALLIKQNFAPTDLSRVIVGNVFNNGQQSDIARNVALRLGCKENTIAWTVSNYMASGLLALDYACKEINFAKHDLILAGGTEAMSHKPLYYSDKFFNLLEDIQSTDTLGNKIKTVFTSIPKFFHPFGNLLDKLKVVKFDKEETQQTKEEFFEECEKCDKYKEKEEQPEEQYRQHLKSDISYKSKKHKEHELEQKYGSNKTHKGKKSKKYSKTYKHIEKFISLDRVRELGKQKDPITGMNMGQIAENLAYKFKISRQEMDNYALQSHLKAIRSQKEDKFANEIIPLFNWKGKVYCNDNSVNGTLSKEKLLRMSSVFDKKFGDVTFGNSFCLADGACLMLLASQNMVKKHNLKPIGKIIDVVWESVSTSNTGLAPVHAISTLLTRNKLKAEDIDCWEINEDFASILLASLRAMKDEKYCKEELGRKEPLGEIDQTKINIDGGVIAIGNPIGATGARLVLHLIDVLSRSNAKYGIASLCTSFGQAGAILVESI